MNPLFFSIYLRTNGQLCMVATEHDTKYFDYDWLKSPHEKIETNASLCLHHMVLWADTTMREWDDYSGPIFCIFSIL